MDAPETIVHLYQVINDAMDNHLPTAVDALADDKAGLAQLLKLHREFLKIMKQADSVIESALLKHDFEYQGEYIEGIGTVRKHLSGKKTRYDNAAVISRLAAAMSDHVALPDRETGEFPPVAVIVQRTVDSMARMTGAATPSFSGWRKSEAKNYGIDVAKYAEIEGGTLSIAIES